MIVQNFSTTGTVTSSQAGILIAQNFRTTKICNYYGQCSLGEIIRTVVNTLFQEVLDLG